MKSVGDYFFLTISIIGSLFSIIAFPEYIGRELNDQGVAGVILLGIFCFLFLGYSIFLVVKYRKKIRYQEIFEDLNLGFSEVHSAHRKQYKNIDEEKQSLFGSLSETCNSLSDCFTKINEHHIGVCIKLLETEEGKPPLVKTLVRDRKSKIKERKTGDAALLNLNSDFKYLYYNYDDRSIDTSYYYKTWLPNATNYENTSLPNNWPPKKIWPINFFIRQSFWPLPYRSTLVVPLVPLIANEQKKSALRGFLCIDSPKNVAFYKDTDKEILRGVADGIYNHIDKFNNLVKP